MLGRYCCLGFGKWLSEPKRIDRQESNALPLTERTNETQKVYNSVMDLYTEYRFSIVRNGICTTYEMTGNGGQNCVFRFVFPSQSHHLIPIILHCCISTVFVASSAQTIIRTSISLFVSCLLSQIQMKRKCLGTTLENRIKAILIVHEHATIN